ncbi:MAG: triose-phosphate isomerase [Lautropia sp.]|nr:triose-phosphate isomerase [Lautropia sp.]
MPDSNANGKRRPLVMGNWKMNGRAAANEALLTSLRASLASGSDAIDVAVCPPFPYLSQAVSQLSGTAITVGAQNLSTQQDGAFTGEVSSGMLKDLGCRWVLVGHSERRQLYGETDEVVANKAQTAIDAGLVPVICIGETLEERKTGDTEVSLARQLDAVLPVLERQPASAFVLAYEPIWAIGTGLTATPEQAQAVHRFLRERLAASGYAAAASVRILYGGSVKASNAAELFAGADVDGGLIGGASLIADDFAGICKAAVGAAA